MQPDSVAVACFFSVPKYPLPVQAHGRVVSACRLKLFLGGVKRGYSVMLLTGGCGGGASSGQLGCRLISFQIFTLLMQMEVELTNIMTAWNLQHPVLSFLFLEPTWNAKMSGMQG